VILGLFLALGCDAASQSSDVDAGPGVSDAGDAGPGVSDAGAPLGPDAGPGCSVMGVAGECRDVADCTGDHVATPGFCPGPASVQCCTPKGLACVASDMPQPNLGLTEAAGTGGCPPGMLLVAAAAPFCVDRHEASLVVAATGEPWSPFFNPGQTAVRAAASAGPVPQGYIKGVQAGAACAPPRKPPFHSTPGRPPPGKRLGGNPGGLRGCRGPADLTFPYGAVRQDGVCNDARAVHPAVEYFGSSDPSVFSMIDHPCLNQLPESLDATGAHAGCVTAEGALDMMGNLHEWTSDPAGTFRGGFYVDTKLNGPGCLYATTAHDTGHWDYSTGFRCCADAP